MSKLANSSTGSRQADLELPEIAKAHPMRRPSFRLGVRLQLLAIVLDMLSIFFAFWLAYELRYSYRIGAMVPIRQDTLAFSQWAQHALVAVAFTMVVFMARGVYQVSIKRSLGDYVPLIATSFGIAIAGVILFAFFIQFSPSRAIYVYVLAIGTTLMLLHRALGEWWRLRLFARGVGMDRALIAGHSENARRLAQSLLGQARWGYRLVGFVANDTAVSQVNVATESGIRWTDRLGSTDDLADLVAQHGIHEVFLIEADHTPAELDSMIESCRSMGVQFRMVPELLQISLDRVDIGEINGVPLIGVRDASIRGWNAMLKRLVDIVLSAAMLIVLAVPAAVLAIVIKRDSTGPVFYTQDRVGQYGAVFPMFKFRTMVTNADELRQEVMDDVGGDSRLFKDRNDPRITRVGAWIRRYSIDEMPQIWNVFRGDMSFVGPRPPLPGEVAGYQAWHQQRLLVRPGMTGLWQVSGRSDLSFDQMVRLDLYYAENWSPWLDIKIMLRTIPAVVFGRGAY